MTPRDWFLLGALMYGRHDPVESAQEMADAACGAWGHMLTYDGAPHRIDTARKGSNVDCERCGRVIPTTPGGAQ